MGHVVHASLLLLLALAGVAAEPERHQVLCLHSYHPAAWTDAIMRGYHEVLSPRKDIDLSVEYMDTKRREDADYLGLLAAIYRSKYSGVRFDLILTSDDHAYNFAVKRRAELFNNAPVVFCGVNRWREVVAHRPPNVTGVAEQVDWCKTLEVARKARPSAHAVHVICDDTETAAKNLTELRHDMETMDAVPLDVPTGLDLPALSGWLSGLPSEDIVVFIAYWRQPDGRSVSPEELSTALRTSGPPVFGRSEWAIGLGQAGGICVSGVRQGRAAATLGLAILNGSPADQLPLITDSPNVAMYDWAELTQHGIDPDLLPADAEVINRPDPLLRIPRPIAAMTLTSLGLLAALVVALVVLMQVRRRSQQATAVAAENLRTILHSMGDGVIATDAAGRITTLNPVAERLTGWPQADAAGRPIEEVFKLIANADRQPIEIPARTAITSGQAHHLSTHALLIDRHGGEVHVADSGAPMRDPSGRIVGSVLVFRDVSERYALEDRLRRAQTMEAMGRMAGGIAHDFNNMLTAVIGGTQLLRQRLTSDAKSLQLADQIETAAQRAAELTGKLLTLSRSRPGRPSGCDLHASMETIAALLRHALNRNIDLQLAFNAKRAIVVGDRVTLENALLNLGLNARDAMPDGGTLRIATEDLAQPPPGATAAPEGWLRLTVTDTGQGMDQATQARVFEPFFTTKPAGKGTGLGLTMVYATITELGGTVQLDSTLGRGTTVIIDLPRRAQIEDIQAQEPPAARVRPGCVLLVDDQEAALAIASDALQDDGHEVLTANDGIAGAEVFAAAKDRIEVVVLDMVTPRADGRTCLAAIRAIKPGIPAILISGYIGDPSAAEGFDERLAKPYRLDDLREAVARQLARASRYTPGPPSAPLH